MTFNCQKPINKITHIPIIRNIEHKHLVCPVPECRQSINSNPYYIYKHLLDKHTTIAKSIGLYVERAKRHATICSYCVNIMPHFGYSAYLHYHCAICPNVFFSSDMMLHNHVLIMHTHVEQSYRSALPSNSDLISYSQPQYTSPKPFPTTRVYSEPILIQPIKKMLSPKTVRLLHHKCTPSELSLSFVKVSIESNPLNKSRINNKLSHFGPIAPPRTSFYHKKCIILESTPDLFKSLRYV